MQRRTFVTGGPVVPEENYFVKRKKELTDFLQRVEQGKYIVIFAPRQTGKTTFLYQAINELQKESDYIPISLDFDTNSLSAEGDNTYYHFRRRCVSSPSGMRYCYHCHLKLYEKADKKERRGL